MRGARGDAARRAEAAQATTSQSAFGDYVKFDDMFGASCIFTAGDPAQVQRQREAYVKETMARKLYVSGNMGVGAFRKNYGGAKNNGTCRHHHGIGSGSVARAVLKQLESVGVVEKAAKGRRITPSGQRDLDRIAGRVKVPVA